MIEKYDLEEYHLKMYGLIFFQKVYLIRLCHERRAIVCPRRHKCKPQKVYDLSHMQNYAADFFFFI